MPCDYSKYPADWFTRIRPDILSRAGNCCEQCGIANYSEGWRGSDGKFYAWQQVEDALELHGNDLTDTVLSHIVTKDGTWIKMTKIVITVAHLDHDVNNNDYSNLMALCQACHLSHDKEHHAANRKDTLNKRRGLIELF